MYMYKRARVRVCVRMYIPDSLTKSTTYFSSGYLNI